jgi:mRNA-degrading endonuclease toxin of MazEF toxin-antitoxin module
VTQLLTIDRARLGRPLGTLSHARLREVLQGLALLFGADPTAA